MNRGIKSFNRDRVELFMFKLNFRSLGRVMYGMEFSFDSVKWIEWDFLI